MASRKTGRIVYKHDLSPTLAIFRIMPEPGSPFPAYTPGQYIALGRDDVPLTVKVGADANGRPIFGPSLDAHGEQRIGSVMHSYSIASAPWETAKHGYLELYVVQERAGPVPGRLSTVLLGLPCDHNEPVNYVDKIAGAFTLDKLVREATRVVMVGTGTGLSPFVSMLKQLHRDADRREGGGRTYTLLHTNRTRAELGYHETLLEIEASERLDFLYVPTISRPTAEDADPVIGTGRATNVLRLLYGLPTTEEEAVVAAGSADKQATAKAALARSVRPTLPHRLSLAMVQERLAPASAVILTCGNPLAMADIRDTAARVGVRAEVEPW